LQSLEGCGCTITTKREKMKIQKVDTDVGNAVVTNSFSDIFYQFGINSEMSFINSVRVFINSVNDYLSGTVFDFFGEMFRHYRIDNYLFGRVN